MSPETDSQKDWVITTEDDLVTITYNGGKKVLFAIDKGPVLIQLLTRLFASQAPQWQINEKVLGDFARMHSEFLKEIAKLKPEQEDVSTGDTQKDKIKVAAGPVLGLLFASKNATLKDVSTGKQINDGHEPLTGHVWSNDLFLGGIGYPGSIYALVVDPNLQVRYSKNRGVLYRRV